jgi:hypothetical protein
MDYFVKPACEVIRFKNNVMTTSYQCQCYDDLLGWLDGDCIKDMPAYCSCRTNTDSAVDANCIKI